MNTRSNSTSPQKVHFQLGTSPAPLRHSTLASGESGTTLGYTARARKRIILISMQKVTRIDSRGLARFMEVMEEIAAQDGELVFFGMNREVRRVFATAKLDQVFRIFATRDEALAYQAGLSLPDHPPLN